MRSLELFAGAGGSAIGLERAGLEHAALVEWDADACATLRAAGLGPVVEGDVRDLDRIAAVVGPSVDVVWSSFPCQAWSQAGKRLGAEDERNGWPWTVDAIDRFRPRWFLGENVPGLACHREGCIFRAGQEGLFARADPARCPGCYLERVILPDLRARYANAGMWTIDAADLGVPQHRRRLILWAGPVALEPPPLTHGAGRRPWVTMGEALELGENAVVTAIPATNGPLQERGQVDITRRPALTINTRQCGSRGGAMFVTHHGPWLARPSHTVTTTEEKGTRASAASGGSFHGGPDRASDALYLATGRRRLTWQECARIQAFPDDHPFQGPIGSRYRQIGNAVSPPMAEAIGRVVVETDWRLRRAA